MRCRRWATATSDRTTRDPEQLSVRLRCLDVRQELSTIPSPGRGRGTLRTVVPAVATGQGVTPQWESAPLPAPLPRERSSLA
ncbi:DUF6207 family protein [Streptomyces africanus]|uniref:DUF6207 family protein n=1 Tax=Streptomyces africanus TaxID=231024 RepID=UPI001FC9891C|nr:DUF6207 family protein [Streptomyces africanus]